MTGAVPGPRVLLVEDDAELAGLLAELLREEGYAVDRARDGQRALHLGLTRALDAVVLDRGLPGLEGTEVVRRWRRAGVRTPVLVLSARDSVPDRVEGLDAGAEDYLVKPFDAEELLARLRALLRRPGEAAEELPLGAGTLVVSERRVSTPGREDVVLSGRECDLLTVLARRPRQVFTREDLLERVFDRADSPGAVDTYVHYLRRKLGRDVVRTVRGIGYRLGPA
jgi:two-component system, OmpR family, response regulator